MAECERLRITKEENKIIFDTLKKCQDLNKKIEEERAKFEKIVEIIGADGLEDQLSEAIYEGYTEEDIKSDFNIVVIE